MRPQLFLISQFDLNEPRCFSEQDWTPLPGFYLEILRSVIPAGLSRHYAFNILQELKNELAEEPRPARAAACAAVTTAAVSVDAGAAGTPTPPLWAPGPAP